MKKINIHTYFASMGRSGSTLIANYFTLPERKQFILVEPNLLENNLHNVNLCTQISDYKLVNDINHLEKEFNHLKSKGYKIGIKEVKSKLHDHLYTSIFPDNLAVTTRNIKSIYLSLLEKHRQQKSSLDEKWSYDYCVQESLSITNICNQHPSKIIIRYEDFILSQDYRLTLENSLSLVGGGEVSRNFERFNREYESKLFNGEIRNRNKPYEFINEKDKKQAEELAEECSVYQKLFDYS